MARRRIGGLAGPVVSPRNTGRGAWVLHRLAPTVVTAHVGVMYSEPGTDRSGPWSSVDHVSSLTDR